MAVIVTVTVVFALGIGALVWMAMSRRPPDDTLALQLAAELGSTPPVLVSATGGVGTEWCLEVDLEGLHRAFVHDHGIRLRRALFAPLGRPARILTSKLVGRDQEDYDLDARTLVPSDEGGVEAVGRGGDDLEGWETRLRPSTLDEMRRLGIVWLSVEPDGLETGKAGTPDAEWVREAAAFLRDTERTLRGK